MNEKELVEVLGICLSALKKYRSENLYDPDDFTSSHRGVMYTPQGVKKTRAAFGLDRQDAIPAIAETGTALDMDQVEKPAPSGSQEADQGILQMTVIRIYPNRVWVGALSEKTRVDVRVGDNRGLKIGMKIQAQKDGEKYRLFGRLPRRSMV